MGYCSGIENYSRIIERRQAGSPPATLLDYFDEDFLKALAKELQEDVNDLLPLVTISKVLYTAKIEKEEQPHEIINL